jgi:hypothetical protein
MGPNSRKATAFSNVPEWWVGVTGDPFLKEVLQKCNKDYFNKKIISTPRWAQCQYGASTMSIW